MTPERQRIAELLIERGVLAAAGSPMPDVPSQALRDLFEVIDRLDDCLPRDLCFGVTAKELHEEQLRTDFVRYAEDDAHDVAGVKSLFGDAWWVLVDPTDDDAYLYVQSLDASTTRVEIRNSGFPLWYYLELLSNYLAKRPGLRLGDPDAEQEDAESLAMTWWLRGPSNLWTEIFTSTERTALLLGDSPLMRYLPWLKDPSDEYFAHSCLESPWLFPVAVESVSRALQQVPVSRRALRLGSSIAWRSVGEPFPEELRSDTHKAQQLLRELVLSGAANFRSNDPLKDLVAHRARKA